MRVLPHKLSILSCLVLIIHQLDRLLLDLRIHDRFDEVNHHADDEDVPQLGNHWLVLAESRGLVEDLLLLLKGIRSVGRQLFADPLYRVDNSFK